jgi:hypothetical protein
MHATFLIRCTIAIPDKRARMRKIAIVRFETWRRGLLIGRKALADRFILPKPLNQLARFNTIVRVRWNHAGRLLAGAAQSTIRRWIGADFGVWVIRKGDCYFMRMTTVVTIGPHCQTLEEHALTSDYAGRSARGQPIALAVFKILGVDDTAQSKQWPRQHCG